MRISSSSVGAEFDSALPNTFTPSLPARFAVKEMLGLLWRLERALPIPAGGRVVQFTSSGAREGTTTLATEAANAASRHLGRRTLLVELVAERLGGPGWLAECRRRCPVGLEAAAQGRGLPEEVLVPVPDAAFSYAALRPLQGEAGWGGLPEVFAALRQSHDLVLIDSPPVPAALSSLLLGGLVDGVVMVVESGRSHAPVAKAACEALRGAGARLAGSVLNKRRPELPDWLDRWL